MPEEDKEFAAFQSFWRQFGEQIDRELEVFEESTGITDQRLVVHIRKSEESLKKRLPRMRLGPASASAQEFVDSIRKYGRARRAIENALARYEGAIEALGLSPSLQVALVGAMEERMLSGRRTRTPSVRPAVRYPINEEQRDLMRQYAVEVAEELFTQPGVEYEDGWIPTSAFGEVLARRIFGEDYRTGNRDKTMSMMIGNHPETYGMERRKDSDDKSYVRPMRPS